MRYAPTRDTHPSIFFTITTRPQRSHDREVRSKGRRPAWVYARGARRFHRPATIRLVVPPVWKTTPREAAMTRLNSRTVLAAAIASSMIFAVTAGAQAHDEGRWERERWEHRHHHHEHHYEHEHRYEPAPRVVYE